MRWVCTNNKCGIRFKVPGIKMVSCKECGREKKVDCCPKCGGEIVEARNYDEW